MPTGVVGLTLRARILNARECGIARLRPITAFVVGPELTLVSTSPSVGSAQDTRDRSSSRCSGPRKSRILCGATRQAHRHDRWEAHCDYPRHDSVDAVTMGGIVRHAGLTPQQFRDLL